jgi:hypothetical protein
MPLHRRRDEIRVRRAGGKAEGAAQFVAAGEKTLHPEAAGPPLRAHLRQRAGRLGAAQVPQDRRRLGGFGRRPPFRQAQVPGGEPIWPSLFNGTGISCVSSCSEP